MARTLDEFFNYENNFIGLKQSTNGPEKLIKSSNTGKRMVVPSYEEDFIFQNDRRKVDFNLDRQIETNWNWNKFQNKIIHKVDRGQTAIPMFTPIQRQVREI